ncbi:MAG: metallophosphoesterase [Turicibacter sp.]|nr:metallophosphoesterase [Turicibacter sp.]
MFKFSQFQKRGLRVTLALSMAWGSFNPVLVSAQVPAGSQQDTVALNAAIRGQNYRNLNLTPGGDNTIMRFTWHSGSEAGSIQIWPQGNPEAVRTLDSTTQPLTSRMAGAMNAAGGLTPTRVGYDYVVHHASAYGLTPEAVYEYRILWDNGQSESKIFRTGGDSEFNFLVAGDPQLGVGAGGQALSVDGSGWQNTLDVATNLFDLDFLLSVGDQIHTTSNNVLTSQQRHDFLFAPAQLHSLPMIPVVGNHDGSGANNANVRMWSLHYNIPESASNVRRFNDTATAMYTQIDYYFRWGNMLMIQVDSNTLTGFGPNGVRTQWLEDVIERNADAEWTVLTYHHAAYPVFRFNHAGAAGNNAAIGNLINNLLPQLERLGVDLILNGHEHVYSRSHQMLGNTPQLEQQWLNADGQIVGDATNAVLDPTGIVHITLNSASGSGYYGVRRIAQRPYVSYYNQNFRRNFSVVNVTDNTLSVTTYQVNPDDTTTLVDVYTIVRSVDGQVPANVTNLRQTDGEVLLGFSELAPLVDLQEGVTLADIQVLLPERVSVETNLRNNNPDNQVITIRNSDGDFGTRVSPAYADVIWDLEGSSFDPAAGQQTFTVSGTVDLTNGTSRAGRQVTLQNPNNVPVNVEIEVVIGDRIAVAPEGFEYMSYFGSRWRFYGRTDTAFLDDAFNPEVFSNWVGGGEHPAGAVTPIGFGGPRSGYNLSLANGTTIPTGAASYQRGTGGVHRFTYFTRTFDLPEDFDVNNMGAVLGTHRIDDNLVLFVNGIEVYRANTATNASGNIRIGEPIDWGTFVGQNTDAQNRSFAINADFYHEDSGYANQANQAVRMHHAASRTNLEQALRPGQNVLTAVVGNNSANSSDLWFDLELLVEILEPEATDADVLSVSQARAAELGEVVTVRGIATMVYETAINNNNSFFLQDPTATGPYDGIHIRLVPGNQGLGLTYENGARNFVGHMVEVTGVRQRPTATNGFFGIDNVAVTTDQATASADRAANVRIVERNVAMPAPVAVSVADLLAPAGESRPFSSMLVSLNEPVQLVTTATTGPGNFPVRAQSWEVGSIFDRPSTFSGIPTMNGNSLIVNLTPMTELPQDLIDMLEESQGWVYVNRAAVHWWNARQEIQLRVQDLMNGDIMPATPPALADMSIDQLRALLDQFLESFIGVDYVLRPMYAANNFTPETWGSFQVALEGALALNQRYANLPQQTVTIRGYFAALVEAHAGLNRINHGEDLGLEQAIVTRVIDGDTIEVNLNGVIERVRFLGVDTPENGEDGFHEASNFVARYAGPGSLIWMEAQDDRDRDVHNRLLRYIWTTVPTNLNEEAQIREHMLNARLLEEGYAVILYRYGYLRHKQLFLRLEAMGQGVYVPALPDLEYDGKEQDDDYGYEDEQYGYDPEDDKYGYDSEEGKYDSEDDNNVSDSEDSEYGYDSEDEKYGYDSEDESIVKDQPVVEEQPAVEDRPVVEEQPAVEDQPVVEEQPALVISPTTIATVRNFLDLITEANRLIVPAGATSEADILAAITVLLNQIYGLDEAITVSLVMQENTAWLQDALVNVTIKLSSNPTYTIQDQTIFFQREVSVDEDQPTVAEQPTVNEQAPARPVRPTRPTQTQTSRPATRPNLPATGQAASILVPAGAMLLGATALIAKNKKK